MPKRKSLADLNCSLAHALDVVGDGWTLLVLRDLFLGARRFVELAQSLDIARNILTERLTLLVRESLVRRTGTQNRPLYELSEKGFALVPGLVALMQWGDRYYAPSGRPMRIVDQEGHEVAQVVITNSRGIRLRPDTVFALPGPGAEPATRFYMEAVGRKPKRRA